MIVDNKEEILKVALTYVPTPVGCSIIGAGRLDFRVRNGAGYDPPASSTTERRINTAMFMLLPFEKRVTRSNVSLSWLRARLVNSV